MKEPTVTELPMEGAGRLFRIESYFGNCFVRTFILAGETAVIIDTALKDTAETILETLKRMGSPRVVAAIHTHGHWDHIGAAAAVKEATGCLIAAHRDDGAMLSSYAENDRRFLCAFRAFPPPDDCWHEVYDNLGPETHVDLQLTGGEVFDLGKGVTAEIVPMRGHSAGCIGIFERSSGMLFTGDSLCGPGPLGMLAQYEDAEAYRATLRRILRLRVREIHSGHFDSIVGGDVKLFLNVCRAEVDCIEECVRHTANKGLDLLAQTREVCRRMNKPFMLQPLFTVSAHLKEIRGEAT